MVAVLSDRDGPPSERPPNPPGCRRRRCLPTDVLPQHLLLLRLAVLLLRTQVRHGRGRRGRHHDLGGHRRWPTVASYSRRQRRLLRLAEGQLLPGCSGPDNGRASSRRGVRPPLGRPVPSTRSSPPRRRTSRRRGSDHVDADREVRRGTRPHPSWHPDLRPRCRGLCGCRGRRRVRTRGSPSRHAGHGPRDRLQLRIRRVDGHLDVVPVGQQHRRRPQSGHQQTRRIGRHLVVEHLPDDLRLLHGARTHHVLRPCDIRRTPPAVGGQRRGPRARARPHPARGPMLRHRRRAERHIPLVRSPEVPVVRVRAQLWRAQPLLRPRGRR